MHAKLSSVLDVKKKTMARISSGKERDWNKMTND